ncbi:ATP-binding protein [Nocardiopsis mangrovi]|uniref:ATP-binding protein n=1 Tax=Nocardiopsis mangrovi TaxID=1179818 RepID=A0ABV9E3G3_9ACTN
MTNNPTAPQILTTTFPREDSGRSTLDRYYWQAWATTYRSFELLGAYLKNPQKDTPTQEWSLICEWHEDFVTIQGDQVDIYSVKHRDITGEKWHFKDFLTKGGILHLFATWLLLERTCHCVVYTNSEMLGQSVKQLRQATEFFGTKPASNVSQEKSAMKVVTDIAKLTLEEHRNRGDFRLPDDLLIRIEADGALTILEDIIRDFLSSLRLVTDLPERRSTHVMTPSSPVRVCLDALGLPCLLTETAWATVESMVRQRMRGVRNIAWLSGSHEGYRVLRSPDWLSSSEFEQLARTLTPRQMIEALRRCDKTGIEVIRPKIPNSSRNRLPANESPYVKSEQHPHIDLERLHNNVLITGSPGVGKTCLAIEYAYAGTKAFPDGQLMVDMQGFAPGNPMSTDDAVTRLLDQLGENQDTSGETKEARRFRYLDIVESGRFVIVLDNVPDSDSVLPLIPRGEGTATIITSRRPLSTLLRRRGVTHIQLNPLSEAEARELLTAHLGANRLAAFPDATDALLRVCDGMPLAITILAAQIRRSPDDPLSSFVSDLADAEGRLDLLDLDEPYSSVRTVFSWTYEKLTPELQEAFVLFGAAPVRYLESSAAGALLGTDTAGRRLRRLHDAHLLRKRADGRFQMHDLFRDFATSICNHTENLRCASDKGNERLIRHYAKLAREASGTRRWSGPDVDTLLETVTHATTRGQVDEARDIADALTEHLWWQGRSIDCADMLKRVVHARPPSPNPGIQAHLLRQLAITLRRIGFHEASAEYAEQALAVLVPEPDLRSAIESHYVLAVTHSYANRHELAVPAYRKALQGFRKIGDRSSVGDALNGLGWSLAEIGDTSTGLRYCHQAREIHRAHQDENNEAADLDSIACIHHRIGNHPTAIEYFELCLDTYRRIGHRPNEARTLASMGDTCMAAGDADGARASWVDAIAILDEIEPASADRIRKKMTGLPFEVGTHPDGSDTF